MDVIDKINQLLAEKGITGAELSRQLGFSTGAYSQWNTKKTVPSKRTLKLIAEYFDVPVGSLLSDSKQKEKPTDRQVSELSAAEVTRKLVRMIAEASNEELLKMMNIIEYVLSQREVNET